jgi:hypothetical protein
MPLRNYFPGTATRVLTLHELPSGHQNLLDDIGTRIQKKIGHVQTIHSLCCLFLLAGRLFYHTRLGLREGQGGQSDIWNFCCDISSVP